MEPLTLGLSEILAAFMLGLGGSTHCLSMCGGINTTLVLGSTDQPSKRRLYVPLFSLGRISSYAMAGLAVGSVSFALQSQNNLFGPVARIASGLLLLAMACYIGRWWMGISKLEASAAKVWKHIQPVTSQFIPVKSGFSALALGGLWGWLPCGLVYSALSWAVLAPHPAGSALLMFCFGVGTLPAMLGAGYFADQFAKYLRRDSVRTLAAMLLVAFALWTIANGVQHLLPQQGDAHSHHHMGSI